MFEKLFNLTLVVCTGDQLEVPLLGRPWLDILVPQWRSVLSPTVYIASILQAKPPSVEELEAMFPRAFGNSDTPIEKYSARLVLKPNAVPVKHRAYKPPFGLVNTANSLLDSWEESGKAIRVRCADWASPGFLVPKSDNSYRMVVDFKKTLNPQLRVDHYPIPSPEEIFSSLSNSSVFVSLDLKDAYTQLSLHPDSQELCVVNTHRGFYKLTRLIYGVASAAAIFQSVMEEMLAGIPGCKQLLKSDKLLMHFDPKLPIVIFCDASPYGVGSVLCHTVHLPSGKPTERPVMFVSSILSSAQQNYAQVDREALAVIHAITKFHRFVWGRPFTIVTDCQAIQRILGPCKSLPVRTGHRLQHWAALLQPYQYSLVHKKSDNLVVADALSRLPSPISIFDIPIKSIKIAVDLPLTSDKIAVETANDPLLQQVFRFVHLGWPPKDQFRNNPPIQVFFKIRDSLSILNKCLLFSSRIVIPTVLQAQVLDTIHQGHPGIVRSKLLARASVWWPTLNIDIAQFVSQCSICALVNFKPNKTYVSWPPALSPFERVHIDFYQKKSLSYFILCDAYSKWLHVTHMPQTSAPFVIDELLSIFAIYGLAKVLVCDNGPPFDSNELATFCTSYNVQILHSPAYHPEANGQAEKGVDLAKKGIEKIVFYRNTPTTTTLKSPNQLLLSYQPRTLLTQLLPQPGTRPLSQFRDGESVMFKLHKRSPVVTGSIVRILGPTRYLISVAGVEREVHHNQLSRAAS
ncbi:hypothetical protein ONE63_011067 [Megalurothrips usitatus]|uniref:RNA-directed DNA polymerase n=1 Tax=Megalurothrips usitatus TaxID=439358 RepID=A0AAV7XEX9_9NEOP|nr:hypothetical protein ONE63_011067 [Megalurothrips usitatus]